MYCNIIQRLFLFEVSFYIKNKTKIILLLNYFETVYYSIVVLKKIRIGCL